MEAVEEYKYLGIVMDNKLTFESQTDVVCRKAHQRMHFLRKLRYFNVDCLFMKMFYSCFIESVLTFSCLCWCGLLNLKNRNRLQSIIKECKKIIGTELNDIWGLFKSRSVTKAKQVLVDPTHPLHTHFKPLPSGRRYALPRCRTNRLKNSFIPTVTGFLNKL